MRYFAKFALCLTVLLVSAPAVLADVTTTPSRLVLSENTRAGKIKVYNSGRHSLRIETGWTAIRQGTNGILHPVPQEPSAAAIGGLHLWPRNFTLKPGETRLVYVLLDPKAPVNEETRIHMRIDADRLNGKGPRWGVALPVFVRPQNLAPTVEILAAHSAGEQSLVVSLYRENGATPYGALVVTDRNENILGKISNITLYANKQVVEYEIPLDQTPANARFVRYQGLNEFADQSFGYFEINPAPGQ